MRKENRFDNNSALGHTREIHARIHIAVRISRGGLRPPCSGRPAVDCVLSSNSGNAYILLTLHYIHYTTVGSTRFIMDAWMTVQHDDTTHEPYSNTELIRFLWFVLETNPSPLFLATAVKR